MNAFMRDAEGATRPETLRHQYGTTPRALESGLARNRRPTEGVRRSPVCA